ncbi:thermonuclease family protein [Vibrio splendidus]
MLKHCIVALTTFMVINAVQAGDLSVKDQWHGQGTVYSVVDGDTAWINLTPAGYKELKKLTYNSDTFKDRYNSIKVRIGNINTPESNHPDATLNTPEGIKAKKAALSRWSQSQVSLSCWDSGKHGRPICSVADKKDDWGIWAITSGHSKYIHLRYGRHPNLHKEYLRASK